MLHIVSIKTNSTEHSMIYRIIKMPLTSFANRTKTHTKNTKTTVNIRKWVLSNANGCLEYMLPPAKFQCLLAVFRLVAHSLCVYPKRKTCPIPESSHAYEIRKYEAFNMGLVFFVMPRIQTNRCQLDEKIYSGWNGEVKWLNSTLCARSI